jgi:serine/threonine-protein kinase
VARPPLDYAHRHGVVHRDIKPENILLQDGTALVADFGIALAARRAGGDRLTETGLSLGTPQYMSPEQATAERALDGRTAVYALGAVLYEMLAGEPPFTGPTAQVIIARILTERPAPPSRLRPNVSSALDALVLKAIERLPADRHQSADALAAQLAAVLERPERGSSARRGSRLMAAAPWSLAALGLAAAVMAVMARPPADGTGPRIVSHIQPPPGHEFSQRFSLALSPDGSRLALVAESAEGQRSLWVRELDSLVARPLAQTDGAEAPFWSADGTELGYFTAGRLRVVGVVTGARRDLCPAPDPAGGAWGGGARGSIVFAAAGDLFRVPASGGECTRLVRGDSLGTEPLQRPSFLPDGRRVVFGQSAPSESGSRAWMGVHPGS